MFEKFEKNPQNIRSKPFKYYAKNLNLQNKIVHPKKLGHLDLNLKK
jgi:hypothetical protein